VTAGFREIFKLHWSHSLSPDRLTMINFAVARQKMVDSQLRARGISDPCVLDAMQRVPRHEFVPEACRAEAYEDRPLPIGEGQTISQPYVVAVMLELLQIAKADTVLEVGAGSGYATALLAEIAERVFAIERHAALADNARRVLAALGYANANVTTGDGALGSPDNAPFDAILVSAAALTVPVELLSQLREGGRMVIPVGSADAQQLQFIRMIDGRPVISLRDPVRFVPLIRS
jgi:protein-L-isoaspartate(D-aspartate) O-methyltransferase